MVIRLYLDYISQPSRAVLAFCLIYKIEDCQITGILTSIKHLDDQYIMINPMKKVPAIYDEDNKLSLGQSHAIIAYLIDKYKLSSMVYPKGDLMLQAKVNEYLHYHHQNTRKCAMLVYSNVFSKFFPVANKVQLDPAVLNQQIEDILGFINQHYFKSSDYIIGKQLTVADLSAYFQILMLELLDYKFQKWSKLDKWMKKMSGMEAIKEANKGYAKMVPKMKSIAPSL